MIDNIDNVECIGITFNGIEQHAKIDFSISPLLSENKILITFNLYKDSLEITTPVGNTKQYTSGIITNPVGNTNQYNEIKIQYDCYVFNKRILAFKVKQLFKQYTKSKL